MANEQNLNPLGSGKLSPEEEYRIRSMGARASNEVQRQKKYSQKVKEEFQRLLQLPYRPGDVEEIECLADINKNTSVALKLYMKLIRDYLETGNPRLLELIMKYSGSAEDTPQEEQEQQQENSLIAALTKQAEEVWRDDEQEKHV